MWPHLCDSRIWVQKFVPSSKLMWPKNIDWASLLFNMCTCPLLRWVARRSKLCQSTQWHSRRRFSSANIARYLESCGEVHITADINRLSQCRYLSFHTAGQGDTVCGCDFIWVDRGSLKDFEKEMWMNVTNYNADLPFSRLAPTHASHIGVWRMVKRCDSGST